MAVNGYVGLSPFQVPLIETMLIGIKTFLYSSMHLELRTDKLLIPVEKKWLKPF